MSVYMYLCMYTSVCIHLCVHVCMHLGVYPHLRRVPLPVYTRVSMRKCVYVRKSCAHVSLCVYACIYPSMPGHLGLWARCSPYVSMHERCMHALRYASMYVSMYECTTLCFHKFMYVVWGRGDVGSQLRSHAQLGCACLHACMHVCQYKCRCMPACMNVCIHVSMYVYICMYTSMCACLYASRCVPTLASSTSARLHACIYA